MSMRKCGRGWPVCLPLIVFTIYDLWIVEFMMTVMEKTGNKLKLYGDPDEYKQAQGMRPVEYAEHQGISKQAVHKHKLAGRLVFLENGNIDAEASDANLDAELDPTYTGNAGLQKGVSKGKGGKGGNDDGDLNTIKKKLQIERLRNQIEEEKFEMAKNLDMIIYKGPTEKYIAGKITTVTNHLKQLPMRVAAKLAEETDIKKCGSIVEAELMDIMEGFHSYDPPDK